MAQPLPLDAQRTSTAATYPPIVPGRAPWWLTPVAKPRRQRQRKISFAEALKDFLQNVSFHCYGKLVEPHRRFHERFFWIVFHITMLNVLIVFLWKTYIFNGLLLVIAMYEPLYPITEVAFPTFSICSRNRMSNASVTRYAEELHMKDTHKRGVNYFYNHLKKLSYFYSNSFYDSNDEEFLEFQNFLDIYDTTDTEMFYNTSDRMKRLTPTCKDILVHCRLAGEDFDCLTEFKDTLTASGLCCTFNADGLYAKPRPSSLSFARETNGLVLLLNSSNSDDFYSTSHSAGFMFYFHSYGSYADVSSGAVNERLVPMGMQTLLSIVPVVMQTVNEARFMSPSVRKCYFEDELPRIFGKVYSFNNCITRCRMHSMLVLCGCVVFMHPEHLLDVASDYVYCTLSHKTCLERYYFKWSNVIAERANTPGLEREMEDSLYCPQCLPACTWVRYAVTANSLPLTFYNTYSFPDIAKSNMSNLALAYVFFGTTHAQLYRLILKDTWVEALSFIGNIISIVTGFSLLGMCEVIFFFGRQLFMGLKNEMLSDRNGKNKKPKEVLQILP